MRLTQVHPFYLLSSTWQTIIWKDKETSTKNEKRQGCTPGKRRKEPHAKPTLQKKNEPLPKPPLSSCSVG